jgi:hypothetical protein
MGVRTYIDMKSANNCCVNRCMLLRMDDLNPHKSYSHFAHRLNLGLSHKRVLTEYAASFENKRCIAAGHRINRRELPAQSSWNLCNFI